MPEPAHPELDKQAWARQERPGEWERFYTWCTTERGYRWRVAGERGYEGPITYRVLLTLARDAIGKARGYGELVANAGSEDLGSFLEECEYAGLTCCRWLVSSYDAVKARLWEEDQARPAWERRYDLTWGHLRLHDAIVEDLDYHTAGWYPLSGTINDLLADYYGIDRDKIEDERRAILAQIRG